MSLTFFFIPEKRKAPMMDANSPFPAVEIGGKPRSLPSCGVKYKSLNISLQTIKFGHNGKVELFVHIGKKIRS
jgi:hypothetical protein